MTPEQIENLRVEKLKELTEAENALSTVEQAYHQTAKDILLLEVKEKELEVKKKDLKMEMDKGRHNLNVKRNEAKILEAEFWQSRR